MNLQAAVSILKGNLKSKQQLNIDYMVVSHTTETKLLLHFRSIEPAIGWMD